MSVSVELLRTQRVIDPRTDVNAQENRIYNVFEGAADIGYQNLSQDGGVSNTALTFTLNPPGPRVFVNRRVMITTRFRLTFAGASGGVGQALLQAAGMTASPGVPTGTQFYDAPRAYPLAKAFQTVQFSLGNDRLGQNLGRYWAAMNRYSNDVKSQDLWHSMTPTMLDQSQQYSDLAGFARDPLRGYGDNPLQCPRGGFVGAIITSNSALGAGDSATVEFEATEMLDLSPFLFERGRQDVGFIGVQNQSLTLNLGGKGNGALGGLASSLWSHSTASPSVFTSVTADVLSASVKVSYLTPDPVMPIPRSANYSYFENTYYPTTIQSSVAAGALVQITQNNIQLQSIPSRILFWVAPQDSDFSITTTDCYYGIESINLSFDNRDSLLSNATQQDLYQIAVKNRTNLSWIQFSKTCGSVIALDFGEDIPLRAAQAPGLRGTFNLRLTVNARNLSSSASFPTMSLLAITEGVMSIVDQNVIRNIGVLSPTDVLNSKEVPGITYHPTGSVYGGAWYDKIYSFLKNVGRPVLNVARQVVPAFYPAAAPVLEGVSRVGEAVGIGRRPAGGKRLTRAQLARMLK